VRKGARGRILAEKGKFGNDRLANCELSQIIHAVGQMLPDVQLR